MELTKLLVKDLMNGKFELFSDYVYKTKEYLNQSSKKLCNRLCKYT